MGTKPPDSKIFTYRMGEGSPMMQIGLPELNQMLGTLPAELAGVISLPTRPRWFDRKLHLCIALSTYCWGGLSGLKKNYPWINSRAIRDEYTMLLTCELLRYLAKFDPNKGNWVSQVKYAKLHAIRSLARKLNKDSRSEKALRELMLETDTDVNLWQQPDAESETKEEP